MPAPDVTVVSTTSLGEFDRLAALARDPPFPDRQASDRGRCRRAAVARSVPRPAVRRPRHRAGPQRRRGRGHLRRSRRAVDPPRRLALRLHRLPARHRFPREKNRPADIPFEIEGELFLLLFEQQANIAMVTQRRRLPLARGYLPVTFVNALATRGP